MAPSQRAMRSRPATRPSPPFDVLAAIGQLLEASNLSIESLLKVDAAALLTRVSQDLACDLLDVPVEQRNALRTAAFIGFLSALGRGFQLGALHVENWRTDMLNVAGRSYEAGELDPESYGYVLGLLMPDRNFIATDDSRVH